MRCSTNLILFLPNFLSSSDVFICRFLSCFLYIYIIARINTYVKGFVKNNLKISHNLQFIHSLSKKTGVIFINVFIKKLLKKVKDNLILQHDADDELLLGIIAAAADYAESYQHIKGGTYTKSALPPTTEQAVIMLASHLYESRDGSTGGFFKDSVPAAGQVLDTVNTLLRLNREWKV